MEIQDAKQARPHNELIAELLDSRQPKTEREHAAAQEIERLRTDLETAERVLDAQTDFRAEIARLRADAARLDWLADPGNQNGTVQLPTECVLAHPESMRAAIDAAMRMG